MRICVDIGNSNAVVGIWKDEWLHIWRVHTRNEDINAFKLELTTYWLETGYHQHDISQVIISSVVPHLTELYRVYFVDLCDAPVHVLGPDVYPVIGMNVGRPNEIGTDLVSNAFAAWKLYATDCLITDFGTALTFLLVDRNGSIRGASIAPGIEMALKTLRGGTAQLPIVPIGIPDEVAGQNTVAAIQSGVIIGYEGMIMHMISKYREWFQNPLKTVATGGLTHVLTGYHKHFDTVNPTLTLDGLRLIGETLSS